MMKMNHILLRRRHTPIRILPIRMSKNEKDMLKFANHWKEEMKMASGVPMFDARTIPESNPVGSMGLAHLKRQKRIY